MSNADKIERLVEQLRIERQRSTRMQAITRDPQEEAKFADLIQRELELKERVVLPFDPGEELKRARGDPGSDGVEHDMDLETSEPMIEEQAIVNVDNLVTDIEENWEDELLDLGGDSNGRS